VAADAVAERPRRANDAVVDHVVARIGRDRPSAGSAGEEGAGIADRIVDPGDVYGEAVRQAVLDIDADHLVSVDGARRGQRRAGQLELEPGLVVVGIDVERGGVRAVGVDPIRDQVVFAGAAAAADALEMRDQGAGVVIGRPGLGGLVVDVAVLESGAAVWTIRIPAGDLVAPDAVGRGADRPRLVVGRVGAGRDVVDEGVAGGELGVVV